jgi:DNA replication protein DnaC
MEQTLTYEETMEFNYRKWSSMPDEERRRDVDRFIAEQLPALEARRAQERLQLSWKQLCPPGYQDTSIERLPNASKFQDVQAWTYGSKGLILLGPTRSGKTRSAWKLLERLHYEGKRIAAYSPMDLKLQVANAWHRVETTEEWISKLRRVELLFLDDLDTIKFTEAVEETIYDIFENRPTHGRPVISTLNTSGHDLAARMNANGRGAKIVERMREYCDIINFG